MTCVVVRGFATNVPPTSADAFATVSVPPPPPDETALIVRLNCFCADCCVAPLSRTRIVKVEMACVVGTPLSTPVDGSSVNPTGKASEMTLHDKGGVPPNAPNIVL